MKHISKRNDTEKTERINVIGDVAGNFKTLMALVEKMPTGRVLSVGDMVDRGPRSKEVLEWIMKNGSAVLGNHEHMLIDYCHGRKFYDKGQWLQNGGVATLESFDGKVPEKIITWLESLPLYEEAHDALISHAFVPPTLPLEEACRIAYDEHLYPYSILWNRGKPERRKDYAWQIAGHNSQFGAVTFSDVEGSYAVCIDASRERKLVGIHLPHMTIYEQEVID